MRSAPKPDQRRRPLYQEVKAYVRDMIQREAWPPHSRVPSENVLVDRLGISRMTVNRALRELSSEGRLYRVQGVGTFVAARKPESAFLQVRSIAEEIQSRGGVHSSDVLLLREEEAPEDIAAVMGMAVEAPVFHAVLLHKDRGVPVQYAERFVNPAIAPDFLRQDFDRITPSAYLLIVAPVTEAEHVVEAAMPEPQIRKRLQMPPDEPALVLYRTTWVESTVATRNRFVYPGSRFRIGGRFQITPDDLHLVI
ncbi:MAG: histidine utilization repressor [Desulfosarcina sp.]|nr:histidine utilization repressor [Desulfobacterales bacterium]